MRAHDVPRGGLVQGVRLHGPLRQCQRVVQPTGLQQQWHRLPDDLDEQIAQPC